MKKIVFALIAVLLLGTFVACDGEADFLLWEDEPAEKVLTLELLDHDYSFKQNDMVFVKSFSDYDFSSVVKWEDLIDRGFTITIYNAHYPEYVYELTCLADGDSVRFNNGSGIYSMVEGVNKGDKIDFSSQFTLAFFY